jgi:hypothetical protein
MAASDPDLPICNASDGLIGKDDSVRRVLAAAALLVAACGSGDPNEDWVVAVTNGDFTAVHGCGSVDGIEESVGMGGSDVEEVELYRVATRAGADAVAECFEGVGFDAEIRESTESDREAFDA